MKATIIILAILIVLFIVYSRFLSYPNNALYYKNILGKNPKNITPKLPVKKELPVKKDDTVASIAVSPLYRELNGLPASNVKPKPDYVNNAYGIL